MTLLPRRSLYAVAAVVDVALHARPAPVSAKALSGRHGLGPRQLETVLQALVRGGILKGMRGPRGGYELARERRRISLGDIVRASEWSGSDPTEGLPSVLVRQVIAPAIAEASTGFLLALDGITVEDLCRRVPDIETGLERDFTI